MLKTPCIFVIKSVFKMNMKLNTAIKLFCVAGTSLALMACQSALTAKAPKVGGDVDKHGCLGAAGFTFSKLNGECVQVFNVADIKIDDPKNPTLAIYVILSADKSQAELFWASKPSSVLMDSVKGGYLAKDGSVQLLNMGDRWVVRER